VFGKILEITTKNKIVLIPYILAHKTSYIFVREEVYIGANFDESLLAVTAWYVLALYGV
jgi:hypothetical protein